MSNRSTVLPFFVDLLAPISLSATLLSYPLLALSSYLLPFFIISYMMINRLLATAMIALLPPLLSFIRLYCSLNRLPFFFIADLALITNALFIYLFPFPILCCFFYPHFHSSADTFLPRILSALLLQIFPCLSLSLL